MVGENVYDLVCPIGQFCGTAKYLKRFYLRKMSMPFDWVSGINVGLDGYVNVIKTDFADFFQRDSLVYNGPFGQDRDGYQDARTGFLYLHDMVRGVSFEEAYRLARTKYDRRIARFYHRVNEAVRVLFVHVARTRIPNSDLLHKSILELREKFPQAHVDLLVLEQTDGVRDVSWAEPESSVFVAKGDFYSDPNEWLWGNQEVCDQVYSKIRMHGKLRVYLHRRLAKLRVRLVGMFHITSEGRRAARQRYFDEHTRGGE